MSEKKMPKGGRKGGSRFPQVPLKQAIEYAKKLVAKTHTGPQPDTIILKGVFNNATSDGAIRASALKQYDLLQGEKEAYDATELARAINSAPPNELAPLISKAFLKPSIFKTIFDTFQNDTISRAKIRQQALQLEVHPDSADKCVDIFIQSALYAGLASETGENVQIVSAATLSTPIATKASDEANPDISAISPEKSSSSSSALPKPADTTPHTIDQNPNNLLPTAKAAINISLSLDSTMDPEKLEKYMKILRQYGAIGQG